MWTMIVINRLHQKFADLDLHCFTKDFAKVITKCTTVIRLTMVNDILFEFLHKKTCLQVGLLSYRD